MEYRWKSRGIPGTRKKKKNPGNNGMKLVQRDREEGTGEEGVEICTGTLRALDAMLTS